MYTDRPTQAWMDVIRRSQETFDRIIGKQAVGFVATSSDFQMDAPQIWHEQLGFQYSSSMRGDDRPYRMCFQGKKSDFIEIPARWELDDYPAFVYSFQPPQPKGQDRISSYRGVLSNWKHEFEGYYAEGGCMTFMLHPQIIRIPGADVGRITGCNAGEGRCLVCDWHRNCKLVENTLLIQIR